MDLFTGYHLKLPIARPSVYPMPVAQLHRIITQAARALAYMHEKDWIHRDVKPENILVNKAGEVRLIDWRWRCGPDRAGQALRGQAHAPGDAELHVAGADPVRTARPRGRYLQLRHHLL